MASRYTPQLTTAWRAAECDCVEHEGTVYAVKVFTVGDEKEVALHGGKVVRCVEYPTDSGAALRLTVTEGPEKEVAEVVGPDGALALRVLECGGSYYEPAAGTWEHVVDVQGKQEAFVLFVSVREVEARIVRVQRLN